MDNEHCPMIDRPCIRHGCKFYVLVQGINPQTQARIDKWDCTFALLPLLLIENSQQQRQTAAAVESLRNSHEKAAAIVAGMATAAHLLPQEVKG